MDSKDFEILASLYANARQSYLSLGRRVSLSSPSVRDRLERLKQQHILQGFLLKPDPSIFNREDVILYFNGEWTRADAKKTLDAPNVFHVALKVDGGLSVQVWPLNRSDAADDLKATLGVPPSWQVTSERKSKARLDLIDLEIIDSLIDDPRIPFKQLVEETGFSPKTVRKHLEILTGKRIIAPTPKLGALSDSGDVIYQILVFGNVEMEKLRPVLGDVVLVNRKEEPPTKYLFCHAKDLGDVTARQQLVSKLPGVESVSITLNRETFVANGFVHSLVKEEIAKLENERRKTSPRN